MNESERESREAFKKLDRAAQKNIGKLSRENEILVTKLYELNEALKCNNYRKLREFESVIDKKYWNEDALFYISTAILCGVANTLEKAIAMYEEFNGM